LEFDFAWRVQKRLMHLGFITAGVTGVAAALCWIPCVSPLLTPILILSARSETVVYGAFLLFVYSLGLTLPFILGGLFFPTVFKILSEHRQALHKISVLAGIFLVVFGAILIFDQYRLFIDKFNALIAYLVKFSR
jgi:cytochrome c-type biogenesis protein